MVQVETNPNETQAEAQAQVPPAEGQGQEAQTPEPEKAKREKPVYAVQPVAELPKTHHRGGGLQTKTLKDIYMPLLSEVAQQPENWFQIAKFGSLVGAKSASKNLAKAIEEGNIQVEGGSFKFDSRRNVDLGEVNEDGTVKLQPSVLYARFDYTVVETPEQPQA